MLRCSKPGARMTLTLHAALGWLPAVAAALRSILRSAARESGSPVALVAAVLLVGLKHALRHGLRFVAEVTVAAAALAIATRLGWIHW
ncbi:MAG: hypothetical protein ABSC94_20700 [Polyangiaceae bacterium]